MLGNVYLLHNPRAPVSEQPRPQLLVEMARGYCRATTPRARRRSAGRRLRGRTPARARERTRAYGNPGARCVRASVRNRVLLAERLKSAHPPGAGSERTAAPLRVPAEKLIRLARRGSRRREPLAGNLPPEPRSSWAAWSPTIRAPWCGVSPTGIATITHYRMTEGFSGLLLLVIAGELPDCGNLVLRGGPNGVRPTLARATANRNSAGARTGSRASRRGSLVRTEGQCQSIASCAVLQVLPTLAP